MLVIERKVGERFLIGDNIMVTITDVRHSMTGFKVKIGIQAPIDIKILREEIVGKYYPSRKEKTYHAR